MKIHPSQHSDLITNTPNQVKKKRELYKVVVLGDYSVGKTSIMERYVNNKFSQSYKATIGADFLTKEKINDNGTSVVLQLWDTSTGRERFRSLSVVYYRGADAFFIVYDVTNLQSFKHALAYKEEIVKQVSGNDGYIVALVGSKKDKDGRQVSFEEAMEIAKDEFNGNLFEVSAKNGDGIEDLMEWTFAELKEKAAKQKLTVEEKDYYNKPEKPAVASRSIVDIIFSWFLSWWQ